MIAETRHGQGSAEWVRARLASIRGARCWDAGDAEELLGWLRIVAARRAREVPERDRPDVLQNGLIEILRAVQQSAREFANAENPAALLERVVDRAVRRARHQASMSGLGGVPANGRNWRKAYPRHVSGDAAMRVLTELPASVSEPCLAVERVACRIAEFVLERVEVELSADAIDAIVYILDRLLDGVSRATLVRSAHSGLRGDPAMRYLGFEAGAAAAFGCWLLGRDDGAHRGPSVLDAFLDGEAAPSAVAQWRRQSIAFGFVADPDDVTAAGALVGTGRRTA
jgi:hypothetical protein